MRDKVPYSALARPIEREGAGPLRGPRQRCPHRAKFANKSVDKTIGTPPHSFLAEGPKASRALSASRASSSPEQYGQ